LTTVGLVLPEGGELAELIDRLIRKPDAPIEKHALGAAHIVVRDSG
jgi:gamma-glutamyl phosphate reductase